jgi:hypothetical protein
MWNAIKHSSLYVMYFSVPVGKDSYKQRSAPSAQDGAKGNWFLIIPIIVIRLYSAL